MQCLRGMLAVLPRQNSDDIAGELFVEMYRRQLGEHPADAITYLVDQATRNCRWFPTIAECLEIVSGWRRWDADTLRRATARTRYFREQDARTMRAAPEEPWKPTAEELESLKVNLRANR